MCLSHQNDDYDLVNDIRKKDYNYGIYCQIVSLIMNITKITMDKWRCVYFSNSCIINGSIVKCTRLQELSQVSVVKNFSPMWIDKQFNPILP